MRLRWTLSALVATACGASSPKPAPGPPAAPPPAPAVARAPVPEAAPAPPPPALPEAPPPAPPGAPRPHVARALAHLPAGAKLVVGLDVPRIARTPIGDKLRAALAGTELPAACQALTAAHFGNLVLGTTGDGGTVGVFDGKPAERPFVACLDAAARAKGGKLESRTVGGRKAYRIAGSAEDNGWLVLRKTGGSVLANSEAALGGALDPKAAKLGGELARLVAQVDQSRMIWGAGIVPAAQVTALGLPSGTVTGDVSVRAAIDLADATEIDVVLEFATAEDAARVATQLRALVAQLRGAPNTAPLVADVRLGSYDRALHVIARLDADVTHKLLDSVQAK